MSLLIKGMEMPEENHDYGGVKVWVDLRVYTDGSVSCRNLAGDFVDLGKCAVEVPTPHGSLKDENWLKKAMITTLEALKKNPRMNGQEMHLIAAFDTLRVMVENAPTVIEAEEGEI